MPLRAIAAFGRFSLLVFIGGIALFLSSCAQQSTQISAAKEPAEKRTIYRSPGDTTSYLVEFATRRERDRFEESLGGILERYADDSIRVDTIQNYVYIRLAPRSDTVAEQMSMGTIDTNGFFESDIIPGDDVELTPAIPEDTLIARGGKAVLYSNRDFIDYSLLRFLSVLPFRIEKPDETRGDSAKEQSLIGRMFGRRDSVPRTGRTFPGYFEVEQNSPLKVTVRIRDSVLTAEGRRPTAFDVVTAWTAYVKKHPAEGLALFRHVKGLPAFIRGEEAIIPGLQVEDEHTITLRLTTHDPKALVRLHTPRLLPPDLKLGPYFIEKRAKGTLTCKPSGSFGRQKPYLDKLSFAFNNDKNPFVSFSLNRYDMIVLQYRKDLDYAKRSLADGGALRPFSTDRYFIALGHEDPAMRRFLARTIDPRDLLAGTAKTDGKLIAAIADTSIKTMPDFGGESAKPFAGAPIRIVYRSDDPLSDRLAEKILADIAQAGLQGALTGISGTEYERKMFAGEYDIAIGWAPQSVLRRESEQLRLATIWFQDETDERKRIAEAREAPLFSVTRHLLHKRHIGFVRGNVAGVYIKQQ